MKIKFFLLVVLVPCAAILFGQNVKPRPVYHPCFLMDSIDKHLEFIKLNAARVFVDTFDCKQTLLDSIAQQYFNTKDTKYLAALAAIRQSPAAKVEELYTDIINRLVNNDFARFLNELYLAKGKYYSLEKELIASMNMIVDGRPYKQKFMGLLNVEISKAKDKKDGYKEAFLNKLKQKIEEEKY